LILTASATMMDLLLKRLYNALMHNQRSGYAKRRETMNKKSLSPTRIIIQDEQQAHFPVSKHPYCPLPPFELLMDRSDNAEDDHMSEDNSESRRNAQRQRINKHFRTLLSVSTWDGRDILSISGKSSVNKH